MLEKRIIIAIDGHSSCGKSTLAKQVASLLGYAYVDSGAMYRAVTLFAIESNVEIEKVVDWKTVMKDINISFMNDPETQENTTYLNGFNVESKIRDLAVSEKVSQVAAIPEVRHALVEQQRAFAKQGGIVMDGRDIGSNVFPDAELKIFMTASVEIRAERRHKELLEKGLDVSFEEVQQNLEMRDQIDSGRDTNPLIQTEDAIVLDNSNLSREEQLEMVHFWALKRINS